MAVSNRILISVISAFYEKAVKDCSSGNSVTRKAARVKMKKNITMSDPEDSMFCSHRCDHLLMEKQEKILAVQKKRIEELKNDIYGKNIYALPKPIESLRYEVSGFKKRSKPSF